MKWTSPFEELAPDMDQGPDLSANKFWVPALLQIFKRYRHDC